MISKVKHLASIGGTDVFPFLMRGWLEMCESGYGSNTCPIGTSTSAFYVEFCGVVVAAIGYTHQDWCKDFWIGMGYVAPSIRKEGHYTSLFNALVSKAQEEGVLTISGSTHVKNMAMREVARKQGRVETFVTCILTVPPKKEEET